MRTRKVSRLFGPLAHSSLRSTPSPQARSPVSARERAPSEPVVQAEAHNARLDPGVHVAESVIGRREIDEQILGAGAQVPREPDLNAGADRPAAENVVLGETEIVQLAFAVGQAAGPIEENVVQRIAETRPHRAEPGIGEFVRGKGAVVRAGELEVGFAAYHDLAELPVVATLHAARDAARLQVQK